MIKLILLYLSIFSIGIAHASETDNVKIKAEKYNPESGKSKNLLAHELTHVKQQSKANDRDQKKKQKRK